MIVLRTYPRFAQLQMLSARFDLLLEATETIKEASLLVWLLWLRNMAPDQRVTLGDSCVQSGLWLFPAAPNQTFTYVWLSTGRLRGLLVRNERMQGSFSRVGLITHASDVLARASGLFSTATTFQQIKCPFLDMAGREVRSAREAVACKS